MNLVAGIAASPGIALGPVYVYKPACLEIERKQISDTAGEWQRVKAAIVEVSQALEHDVQQAHEKVGSDEAAIFEAHLEMLDDPEFLDQIRKIIEDKSLNAEAAVDDAAEAYACVLENMTEEYFRARAMDIRDVKKRVLRSLLQVSSDMPFNKIAKPAIIVAHDLTPSDTISLDKKLVLGFCTASGGSTSHTAILARGLGLPAVVGAGEVVLSLSTGEEIILDGNKGQVTLGADAALIRKYRQDQESSQKAKDVALESAGLPAVTKDGQQVEIVANIGSVEEAARAKKFGAEGVGLLRTEFLYLSQTKLPSEEEQYQAYRGILDVFGQQPVILRTLDIGGDKEVPYLNIAQEMNSFLGVRAFRLCMQRPDLFKPQLRAALRAAEGRNLLVMFPMIATVQEVLKARQWMDDCRAELISEGYSIPENIKTGIMVEIPSAVLLADHLSKIVDFFSIGTNDLTQYTMAADRTNPGVGYLSSAFSPAVLRLIRMLIETAHANGKWVGMCGELAGEPVALPILLGLGLDEFSMNAPAIPTAKTIIRSLNLKECREVAEQALKFSEAEEVIKYVRERLPIVRSE